MRPASKLSGFSLIVTGDCNFRCSYCYQDRDDLALSPALAARAIEAFFPRFDRECAVLFYGGEPLLAMDAIREAVAAAAAKNRRPRKALSFSISTNGSLLSDEILDFFDRHRFTVLLSFDGLAQDKARRAGSLRLVSEALDRLLGRPAIELFTNSVFTPKTVSDLSASIRDIVGRGVREAQISFATDVRWDGGALARLEAQLRDVRRFLLPLARKTGLVPVINFRRPETSGIFHCLAGENRMALSPDGRLWGCHLFYDFNRKSKDAYSARYCFGALESFIAHPETSARRVLPNYADLRMDYFHTPGRFCGQCADVADCVVCPVDAAFSSGIIGRITTGDCRIRTLVRTERRLLWEGLGRRMPRPGSPGRPSSR